MGGVLAGEQGGYSTFEFPGGGYLESFFGFQKSKIICLDRVFLRVRNIRSSIQLRDAFSEKMF